MPVPSTFIHAHRTYWRAHSLAMHIHDWKLCLLLHGYGYIMYISMCECEWRYWTQLIFLMNLSALNPVFALYIWSAWVAVLCFSISNISAYMFFLLPLRKLFSFGQPLWPGMYEIITETVQICNFTFIFPQSLNNIIIPIARCVGIHRLSTNYGPLKNPDIVGSIRTLHNNAQSFPAVASNSIFN